MMMLKLTRDAFKRCTSSSTGEKLSRRERECAENTVHNYFQAMYVYSVQFRFCAYLT